MLQPEGRAHRLLGPLFLVFLAAGGITWRNFQVLHLVAWGGEIGEYVQHSEVSDTPWTNREPPLNPNIPMYKAEGVLNNAGNVVHRTDVVERPQVLATNYNTTIAYVVSVTSCQKLPLVVDGAAVLKHSIHLNSIRNPNSGSKYDYNMIAFVHPDAEDCMEVLERLKYEVIHKNLPFSMDEIRGNEYRYRVNRTGCCGEKEWLKLYAYTLTDYPVVVHLDLDCLVLRPLDALFDSMIDPTLPRDKIRAMWIKNPTRLPQRIDAYFTRDYGMLSYPGFRKVHQIGVQGGFLVIRPDLNVFRDYIELILEGNYTEKHGWGGVALKYGGYYGAGTIQGLAALYYGHLHPEHAVELNRCRYNNMRDMPYPKKFNKDPTLKEVKNPPCLTSEKECEDCRTTLMKDIHTIHLTNCLKPWHCIYNTNPLKKHFSYHHCIQHHYEWYRIRHLLECEWKGIVCNSTRTMHAYRLPLHEMSFGACARGGGREGYTPISQDLIPRIEQVKGM